MKAILMMTALFLITSVYAGAELLEIMLPGKVPCKMILVQKGTFNMGTRDDDADLNEAAHKVVLTQDFYIGETEITQKQWTSVMKKNPSTFRNPNRPVERVRWSDAMKFCQKLNKMKLAPHGWQFTLPTEAQWEYAARGGNKSKGYKYSGSNKLDEVGVYTDNAFLHTHDVKSKQPNELGLYDMSGNVWEWCRDQVGESDRAAMKTYKNGIVDPLGKDGEYCIYRGGSWCYDAACARVTRRGWNLMNSGDNTVGFRLALIRSPEK